jgi:hypothetical protein
VIAAASAADANATVASWPSSFTKNASATATPAPNQTASAAGRRRASRKNTATPVTPTSADCTASKETTNASAWNDEPARNRTASDGATIITVAAPTPRVNARPNARASNRGEPSRANFGK